MPRVEVPISGRIGHVLEMFQALSAVRDPVQLQREYATRIRRLQETYGYVSLSVRGLAPGQYKITRVWLDEERPPEWADVWKNNHLLSIHTGGFLSEVISTPEPKLYHDLNIPNDPVLGVQLAGLRSAIAVPLFDGGQALNWGLSFRRDPKGFTPADLEDFLTRGNLVGGMVKNLVNARRVEELNAKLVGQLEEIASIQRSLLPDRLPDVPGISIATSYLTSNEAGGDYYDFFDMGEGRWGTLVADVSGHGAGAATVVAMLHAILHDYPHPERGPAAMLTHANTQLVAKRFENNFVTAFFGMFDEKRRTFTYANAGHNRPQHRTRRGEVVSLEGGVSIPLGIMDETRYELAEATIEPGDTVVLYTDGITEAFSPPPDRVMFGTERLQGALEMCSGEPPCVVESIHERLYDHTRSRERADDQTLVALRVEK